MSESPNSGMDESADWEALARYFAGEAAPDEAARVEQWLAEDSSRVERVRVFDRALDRFVAAPPADLDVEGALARVKARMHAPEAPAIPFRAPPSAARRRAAPWMRRGLQAAAVLAFVVAGAILFRLAAPGGDAGAGAQLAQRHSTGVGERDSLYLADGTFVLLGPGTQLIIPAEYGEDAREVALQGEALFRVEADATRPFLVRAGASIIQDLGTEFTVRMAEGGVQVIVTDGTVAFRPATAPPDQGVLLRQGDRAEMVEGGQITRGEGVLPEDLAWTQGVLAFRDAPMARVRMDLLRWYGVELLLEDPALAERHLTASFAGEPVEQVLDVIALALGGEVTMRGDTAVIRASTRPGP